MEPQVPRISLTLPAINEARHVVFLVTGKDKAKAVKRAFGDPRDIASPAAHVRPTAGEITLILDGQTGRGGGTALAVCVIRDLRLGYVAGDVLDDGFVARVPLLCAFW